MTTGHDIAAGTTGVAWVQRSGTTRRTLTLWNETTGAAATGTAGTYTLYDSAGVSVVASSSLTHAAGLTYYDLTPGAVAIGPGHYEEWSAFTFSSGTLPGTIRRPVYVSALQMVPSVTTGTILDRFPALTAYPDGQVSWEPQIDAAFDDISRKLVNDTKLQGAYSLWNPDALTEDLILLALVKIHEAAAAYQGRGFLAQAAYWREQFEVAWASRRLQFDSDGDGDVDTEPEVPQRSGWPPPGAGVVRRG